jgi:hypothetical protein
MEIRKADYIYYGLLLIVIILLCGVVKIMTEKTTQCLKNPYIYGAKNMKEVSCSCTQGQLTSFCPALFYFNDTSFWSVINVCGDSGNTTLYPPINWSVFGDVIINNQG